MIIKNLNNHFLNHLFLNQKIINEAKYNICITNFVGDFIKSKSVNIPIINNIIKEKTKISSLEK